MASNSETAFDRVIKPWWAKVALGVLVIVTSVMIYNDFSKLESGERESLWVGRSTHFLYEIGGKSLAAGLPSLVGLGCIGWGVWQVSRKDAQ